MDGKLTSLFLARPIDQTRVLEYGSWKKLDIEDLRSLLENYIEFVVNKNTEFELTPFHIACSISKPELVATFLEEGWNVNYKTDQIDTPLHFALKHGNIPVVHLLLESGADVTSTNSDGFAPMFSALATSNEENTSVKFVKLLLKAGVQVNSDINIATKEKPIHIAIINNLPLAVSCLLQNGADVNAQDLKGMTPLHTAINYKNISILKLLVLRGADFYIENGMEDTPMLSAVAVDHKDIIEYLAKSGYDLNRLNKKKVMAPLHSAVLFQNLDIVKLMISYGANPNLTLKNGLTPLYCLVANECTNQWNSTCRRNELASFLIENGADLNVLCEEKLTPLEVAMNFRLLGLAKLFLRMGANPNVKLPNTTLFHVVVLFHHDIIVTFLKHGADYNAHNSDRLTPYLCAISKNVDLKFIKSFVKHGCPYNQRISVWNRMISNCDHSITCFFKAERRFFTGIMKNNLRLVKDAVQHGALVTSCSEELKYPLHFLAFKGYKEVLTYLLEEQYPPNFVNAKGKTALHIAAKKGDYDICCILLRYGASYNYCSKKFPKTPKKVAHDCKHTDVENLLNNIERMFCLAKLKDMSVIKDLKKETC